jgi:hypothetical protein
MPDIVLSNHDVALPNSADQLLPSTPELNFPTGTGSNPFEQALGSFEKTISQGNKAGQLNIPFASALKPALRYTDPELGYHPFDDQLEYKYADAHPWQTLGNNVLQFGARTAGAFLESIATIPIIVSAAASNDFSKLYDNALTNNITDWLDTLNESLPTYRSEYEEEHPVLKYLNFLQPSVMMGAWGGAVNNLGFTAGAIAGAVVTDLAIGAVTGGIGVLPAMAAQGGKIMNAIGKAGKAVALADDAALSASRGLVLAERGLVQAERGLVQAEAKAGFQAAGRVDDLLAEGTQARQAAVNRMSKLAKISSDVRYNLGLTTSAAAEGAFEAAEVYNRGIEDLKQEFFDRYGRSAVGDELAQIEQTSKDAANVTMAGNMAILYLSNRVNWGSLFQSTERRMAQQGITGWFGGIKKVSVKGKLTDVTDDAGTAMLGKEFKYAVESIAPSTRVGKVLLNAEKAARIGSRSINESLEEGAQFTLSEGSLQYARDKYNPYVMNEAASLLKGFKYGLDKTVNTNEGWDNMVGGFIGGLLGGAIMGRIQRKMPISEQMATQAKMLNEANFNGVLGERLKDVIAQNSMTKRYEEQVRAKDVFAAKNTHYDMLFNWVNSGYKANAFERRMDELDTLRALEGEGFKAKWGLEDTAENREIANKFLDNMKQQSLEIKANIEKVRRITKNPFKPTDVQNYSAYEMYKDELAHNLSAFTEYKRRINGMTAELKAKFPLMDVAQAVNLTSVQGMGNVIKQTNAAITQLDTLIRESEGNQEAIDLYTTKKEALQNITQRLQSIIDTGVVQTSTDSVTGARTQTGRTEGVQFNGELFLGALEDLYNLYNGTSLQDSKYVQKYVENKQRNKDGVLDITAMQTNEALLEDDTKADLLEKLQDIYKLTEANYNIGKFYTYLRKGLGATEYMKAVYETAQRTKTIIDNREQEAYAKEREGYIREEEIAAIVPEEGDEDLTKEEEATARTAAEKVVKKQPLTKEEEEVVAKKPKIFKKYVNAEKRTKSRLEEEGIEEVGINTAENKETQTENDTQTPPPVNGKGEIEPFAGIRPQNLFGMFSQDLAGSKLRTNLYNLIFKNSKSAAAVIENLFAVFTTDIAQYGTTMKPIPGTKLFRKPFEENLRILNNDEQIGILRPPTSIYLDEQATRTIFDMTEAEYADMTGNQANTYAEFMKYANQYRDSYNAIKAKSQNGETVSTEDILTFFNVNINLGSRKASTSAASDINLRDLTHLPEGSALISLDSKGVPTIVNLNELNAKQAKEAKDFVSANKALIGTSHRYVVLMPILGEYRKAGIIIARNAETTKEEREELVSSLKQVASAALTEEETNAKLVEISKKFYITASRDKEGLYIDFRFDDQFNPYVRFFNRSQKLVEEIQLPKAVVQSLTNAEDLIKAINAAIATAEGRQTAGTPLSKMALRINVDSIKRQIPPNKDVVKLSDLGNVLKLATPTNDVFINFNLEFDPITPAASTANPAPQPSPQSPAPVNVLPKDLAGAKPRYSYGSKQFTLSFANDIDKAAYIAAQKSKSPRDTEYVQFVISNTGLTEAEVRALGERVKEAIKQIAKDQAGNTEISVPSVYSTATAAPTPVAPTPAAPIPAAPMAPAPIVTVTTAAETPAPIVTTEAVDLDAEKAKLEEARKTEIAPLEQEIAELEAELARIEQEKAEVPAVEEVVQPAEVVPEVAQPVEVVPEAAPVEEVASPLTLDPAKAFVIITEKVEETVTDEEAEEVMQELGLATIEEAKAAVVEAVVEDVQQNGATIQPDRPSALSRIVGKIKKLFLSLFLVGTIFSAGAGIYGANKGYTISDAENFVERTLVKQGLTTPKEATLELVKEQVTAIAPTTDTAYKKAITKFQKLNQDNSGIWSFRNQFMNEDGFVYIPGVNNKNFRENKETVYKGVAGVAHHMIMLGKADDLTTKTTDEALRQASQGILNNTPQTDYIPLMERLADGSVRVKYVSVAEAKTMQGQNTFSPVRLRQAKVSDLDFDKASSADGFKSSIKAVTQRSTGKGFNSLVYTTKDSYGKFSGGSSVLIFKDAKGNLIVREYSGSINGIQAEIQAVKTQFGVTDNDITLGVYDAGSYTGKVGAINGEVSPSRYSGYNPMDQGGSSLMIPDTDASGKTMGGITALSLLASVAGKRRRNEPIGPDDVAAIKARIAELRTQINAINQNYEKQIADLSKPTAQQTQATPTVIEPTYVSNKEALIPVLKTLFNLTDEQAETNAGLINLNAQAWARRTGQPIEDFYKQVGFGDQAAFDALTDTTGVLNQIIGEEGAAKLTGALDVMNNLGLAKLMHSRKIYSRSQIRAATFGWELMGDGKWRYEIPDVSVDRTAIQTKIAEFQQEYEEYITENPKGQELPIIEFTLGELLFKDSELLKAYPQLKDFTVVFYGDTDAAYGFTNFGDKAIGIKDRPLELMYSTILHEIQHVIQNIEGFATGGNLIEFELENEKIQEQINVLEKQRKAAVTGNNKTKAAELGAQIKTLRQSIEGENTAYEKYKRVAGESEARNVQYRLKLTDLQRLQTTLDSTDEIDEDSKIYLDRSVREALSYNGNSDIQFLRDYLKITPRYQNGVFIGYTSASGLSGKKLLDRINEVAKENNLRVEAYFSKMNNNVFIRKIDPTLFQENINVTDGITIDKETDPIIVKAYDGNLRSIKINGKEVGGIVVETIDGLPNVVSSISISEENKRKGYAKAAYLKYVIENGEILSGQFKDIDKPSSFLSEDAKKLWDSLKKEYNVEIVEQYNYKRYKLSLANNPKLIENNITNGDAAVSRAIEIVNSGAVKGFSALPLIEAANTDVTLFKGMLREIAEQVADPNSVRLAVEAYGQELVDIAKGLQNNGVLYQSDLNKITSKDVERFGKIGITNPYTIKAILDIGLGNTKFEEKAINAAILSEFKKLIANIEKSAITEKSQALTNFIKGEIAIQFKDNPDILDNIDKYIKDNNLENAYLKKIKSIQLASLKEWKDYLKRSEYSPAFKYLVLKDILKYNYNNGKVVKRNNATIRNFITLDAAALAEIYANQNKKVFINDYVAATQENANRIADAASKVKDNLNGEWIKFDGGPNISEEELDKNTKALQGFVQNTTWCTSTLAREQLKKGDFYVYYIKSGKDFLPKVAIRMEGDSVGEVRGNTSGQRIETAYKGVTKKFIEENDLATLGSGVNVAIAFAKKFNSLVQDFNNEITEEEAINNIEVLQDKITKEGIYPGFIEEYNKLYTIFPKSEFGTVSWDLFDNVQSFLKEVKKALDEGRIQGYAKGDIIVSLTALGDYGSTIMISPASQEEMKKAKHILGDIIGVDYGNTIPYNFKELTNIKTISGDVMIAEDDDGLSELDEDYDENTEDDTDDRIVNQDAKGAFDQLRRVIYALTNPDITTFPHELAHQWEKFLTDAERQTILDWAGQTTWTRATSEAFARGFEVYLSEGNNTNNPELDTLFNNFAKWIAEIYANIKQALGIELNDPMRQVYSNMLNSEFISAEVKATITAANESVSETSTQQAQEVNMEAKALELAEAAEQLQETIDSLPLPGEVEESDYNDMVASATSVYNDMVKTIEAKYAEQPIEEAAATTETEAAPAATPAPRKRKRKAVKITEEFIENLETLNTPEEKEAEVEEAVQPAAIPMQYVSFMTPTGETDYGIVTEIDGNFLTIKTADNREIFRTIAKVNNITEKEYNAGTNPNQGAFTYNGVDYKPKFSAQNTVEDAQGNLHVIESVELIPDVVVFNNTAKTNDGQTVVIGTRDVKTSLTSAKVIYTTTTGLRLAEDGIRRRVFNSGQDQKELKDRYTKHIKSIDSLLARLSQFFGGIRYEYVELPFNAPARFYKGMVQINLNYVEKLTRNSDEILVHEFMHPFVKSLKMNNIKLYNSLVAELQANYPQVVEEAANSYNETDFKETDLLDEALTIHLGRSVAQAFRNVGSNSTTSILYSDTTLSQRPDGMFDVIYKGEVLGQVQSKVSFEAIQALADQKARELNPLSQQRKNLYIRFRNWFNNVISLIKDQKSVITTADFIKKANAGQKKFKFFERGNLNSSIEFEKDNNAYISVFIDPSTIKDSYDVHNLTLIINRAIGTDYANSNESFTENDANALELIIDKFYFGSKQSVNKNTFTTAKLNGEMNLDQLATFIGSQLATGDVITGFEFEEADLDAFDLMEAYFDLTDEQLKAMRKRITDKFDLLEETADKRIQSDTLTIQKNAARRIELDSKTDLEYVLGYMEHAAVSINIAYTKYGQILRKLKENEGVLSRKELNALNKEFAVLRQLISYYDQFSSYTQFSEELKATGKKKDYYSDAFTTQQRMREGMQDLATRLTVEWLAPYAKLHSKLMKEQGYSEITIDPKTGEEVDKYEVTYDKLYKLFRYGGGRDTNFISFWLGSNVTSRDPVNAMFANTLGDMLSINNIKIAEKADDFAIEYDKFLKAKGFSSGSSALHRYYKDNFMRKAKVILVDTDPDTGVRTERITEKWALHQPYKLDEYEIDLQKEKAKYKNPISNAQALEFQAKLEAFKKANNNGKIAKYANPDYAKAAADPFFKSIETTYNDSNLRYGTNQLRFGIIPQKYSVSNVEKLKRLAEIAKGENKVSNLGKAALESLAGGQNTDLSYNLDGSVFRNINTTLTSIKEEENISTSLEDIMPSFIVESNNYSTLRETQYNAETIMLLLEGNQKLSISPRTFAQEDFNSKIRQPFQLKALADKLKELEALKAAGDPAFVQKDYDALKEKYEKGVQPYNLYDSVAKRFRPSGTDYNNQMLIGMIKDRYFGESTEETKIGKISATKAAHLIRLYTSINNMAGNYVAGLGNITVGNTQLFIEAHGGKYFTKADLAKAIGSYATNIPNYIADLQRPIKSKDTQLSIMLDAIQGEIENEFGERITGNIAQKMFRTSSLFLLTRAGEHQLQITNMKAMMFGKKVQTNKGEEINLYEAFVTDAEGRVSLRKDIKFTQEDLTKFIRDMHGVNRMLNGNYSDLHKTMLQRKWYGNLLLSYRKYLYPSIRARYGSERVDYERNTVEVGYLRYFFFDYIPTGLGNMLKGKGGFPAWKNLKPHQKYALRKTSAELGMYGALTALGVGLFGSGDDENKQELTEAQKFGLLMLLRLRSDIGMYHIDMPSETLKQLKNPTASLQTVVGFVNVLKQLGSPFEVYEQDYGVHKEGDSKLKARMYKLVPIVSKFQSTTDDKLGYYDLLNRNIGDFVEGVTPKNDSR